MENFWIALELMGKGMLGIFTVDYHNHADRNVTFEDY